MIADFSSFVSVACQVMAGGVAISFMAWLIGWTVDAALTMFHR